MTGGQIRVVFDLTQGLWLCYSVFGGVFREESLKR